MAAVAAKSPSSLLPRLVLGATLALVVALGLIAWVVDRGFRAASEIALRDRLESTVYLLLSTLEIDADGRPRVPESPADSRLNRPGSGLHAGVVTAHGQWQSASLVGVMEPPRVDAIARGQERFAGPAAADDWHSYAIGLGWELDSGEILSLTLWAAEDPGRYRDTVQGFRGDMYRWMALAAALLIGVQMLILWVLLRPLRQIAGDVASIESGRQASLTARYPRELQPLTANLNALLATERSNATHYRQALADLAHALKTPLAVLRTRLEAGECSIERFGEALEEMEHLIRRQLERARRSTRRTLAPSISVMPIVRRLSASMERLYRDEGVVFETSGDARIGAGMDERDLMELLGNLMDNAAKYGAGRVRVTLSVDRPGRRQPGIRLCVHDNGPGIDPGRFEALLQRGVRDDERRDGQGLGLAIAQQLVDAYDGRLDLIESELGGAGICVVLPPR